MTGAWYFYSSEKVSKIPKFVSHVLDLYYVALFFLKTEEMTWATCVIKNLSNQNSEPMCLLRKKQKLIRPVLCGVSFMQIVIQ